MRAIYLSVAFLLIFSSLLFIGNVSAHGPASVGAEFDFENQELNVTITHSVASPGTHYIESVEIFVNEESVQKEDYSSQPNSGTFSYVFEITASDGDIVRAVATCSVAGTGEDTITIEDPNRIDDDVVDDDTTDDDIADDDTTDDDVVDDDTTDDDVVDDDVVDDDTVDDDVVDDDVVDDDTTDDDVEDDDDVETEGQKAESSPGFGVFLTTLAAVLAGLFIWKKKN